jgi:DNA invertase Pin-like site-specific DNA recombinase
VKPELDKAVALARELRSSGTAVTIVVHDHKRLGRGIELAQMAEQLRADGIALQFLTGELQGSHDPSDVVFTVLAAMSGMEREYIRDKTLEGQVAPALAARPSAAAVTGQAMLPMALHLRDQGDQSLRGIASNSSSPLARSGDSAPGPPP